MWKDATVANFETLKEDGKYVPFGVSFQNASIRQPSEFSQSTCSITLNGVHRLFSAGEADPSVKYKLALPV
jgi:hypothetical protein